MPNMFNVSSRARFPSYHPRYPLFAGSARLVLNRGPRATRRALLRKSEITPKPFLTDTHARRTRKFFWPLPFESAWPTCFRTTALRKDPPYRPLLFYLQTRTAWLIDAGPRICRCRESRYIYYRALQLENHLLIFFLQKKK